MNAVALPQFVPPKTVASAFGVTADTAIRWLRNGKLPGGIQVGRHWFMRADALEKLVKTSAGITEQNAAVDASADVEFARAMLRKHGVGIGR